MDNQEFDHALRNIMTGSKLPYNAAQWNRMNARLDAHYGAPSLLTRNRVLPLIRWTSLAVAACLFVLAAIYIQKPGSPAGESATLTKAVIVPAIDDSPKMQDQEPAIPPTNNATLTPAPPIKDLAQTSRGASAKPFHETATATTHVPARASIVIPAKSDSSTQAFTKKDQIAFEKPLVTKFSLHEPEEDAPSAKDKIAFGVNGGYNIGRAKNNFTVGVTVKNKLGNRLVLETGLALVSGAYESHRPTGGVGFDNLSIASSARTYEPVANRLMYLQAAPSLSYRIYKGFSAGGGVDAQRLLGNNEKSVALNSIGEQTASQPQWDFGLTARMDVQVARKLRAGMMYRESMRAITKGPTESAGRNYLLLQLSYTLFE